MLKTLSKFSFSTKLLKNILVIDADPMDISINDFPQECLDKDVSPRLNKKYLSLCKESQEDIQKTTVHKGVIMGRLRRLFLSIPTKHQNSNKYFNVHYLLNTGSPITTITRKALCAIHQKQFKSDYQGGIQFPMTAPYKLAGQQLHIQCSNPNKESMSRPYHNVNLLGMDFFQKFEYFNLKNSIRYLQFVLQLSKEHPKDWDKASI